MIFTATGRWAVVLCAAAVWAAGCGMRPPREYNDVSNADQVDLTPLPPPAENVDAGPSDDVDASPDGPGMGTLSIGLPWAAVPVMPIAELLGKTRKEIETLQAPVKPKTPEEKATAKKEAKEGWTRFTPNLKVRFDDDDIAIELEQQVPAGLSCLDAAKWLGFADAKLPVEAKERCTWTADGANALGNGARGEMVRKSSVFNASKPAPAAATH
jgi:hypothetical protein